MIFVFGSNLAGIHGAGAAATALEDHGAVYGMGKGLQGRSYAIPTKGHQVQTLSLSIIERYVLTFLVFATTYPELTFKVTRIGCGLAGYKDAEIAPMFRGAPRNCQFDYKWSPYLQVDSHPYSFWGTM